MYIYVEMSFFEDIAGTNASDGHNLNLTSEHLDPGRTARHLPDDDPSSMPRSSVEGNGTTSTGSGSPSWPARRFSLMSTTPTAVERSIRS